MFKRITVALDGSECAEQALQVALKLAETEQAELAICSVVDPIMIAGTAPPSPGMELVIREMETTAALLVAGAVEAARKASLVAIGETRAGVAAFEILKYAKEVGADAIVMGTHGRGGIRRFFMGSVAETVLRESPVPVIIVRERQRVAVHA
ncbi:MAG: universal stress protein [Candidatus Eremiobacteraeota bacterium]|nr:universal stress protein [Candidatus Eremiobacteraeota bacterium]